LFSQFFTLIYLWIEKNSSAIVYFFRIPENQKVIISSFQKMAEVMRQYDTDNSRRLSRNELDKMFLDLFPEHVRTGHYTQVMNSLFPDQVTCSRAHKTVRAPDYTDAFSGQRKDLSLRSLVMVYYGVLSMAAGSRLRGLYVPKSGSTDTDYENLLTVQRGLQVVLS
jgi:hypothetical protein